LNPKSSLAYGNRGALKRRAGDLTGAVDDCTRAIAMDPNLPSPYINRAITYYTAKDYTKAWADVHKAQALGATIDPKFLSDLAKSSGQTQ